MGALLLSSPPPDPSFAIASVVCMLLSPGVSLTLIGNSHGSYRFAAWSRHDTRVMPRVSEEDQHRVFDSVDDAVQFFRNLQRQRR